MKLEKDISELVQIIKDDGLVIIPTDTIYGFSCLPTSNIAVDRINDLKQRGDKPFIILDTDEYRMRSYFKYAFADKIMRELIDDKVWPGKLTVIADKCSSIDYPFLSNVDTIAIRYPDNELIRSLNLKLNSGIVSTSVNGTGEKELNSISEIKRVWSDKVDHIYEDNTESSSASLIIKINSEFKEIEVVRDPETIESKEIMSKLDKIVKKCR
ncbi:MAG: Sua5/YciO/YrdC/YwlC family protein [Candidatus Delongbacteria bacterium]|jgi:L-threonylcarbamoyladenylate synthase|nr:Sua5/YciO/YrdC/YwlC family protein [Candidatus Delongbacteria bacterium]